MRLYLSQTALLKLITVFFSVGFLLAPIYDILRISRRRRKSLFKGRLLKILDAFIISAEDILFFVFCGAVFSIIFYVLNSGKVRPLAFLMAFIGFFVSRKTLSRLFVKLSEKILTLFERVFGWVFGKLKLPILKFASLIKRVIRAFALKARRKKTERFLKSVITLAKNGFA